MRHWILSGLIMSLAVAAFAVVPAQWQQGTEADFTKGQFDKTAVTSLGEVVLSRDIDVLLPAEQAPAVVSALASAGKTLYVAAGSENVIYKVKGDKAEKFTETPGAMVVSLLWTGKKLLAGTGGEDAGIYSVDKKGDVKPLWTDQKVKYVWAMAPGKKGDIYAATGPEAKVFLVSSKGKAEMIYEAGELAKNILSLAVGRDGLLYAGTDENGLVVEINPKTKASRILLDANEKEIAALLTDEAGGLYAATSDSAKASTDGAARPNNIKTGKAATSTRPAGGKPTTSPASRPAKAEKAGVVITPATRAAVMKAIAAKRAAVSRAKPARPGKGNAVYYIAPDGLVKTVFRRPVTILAMMMHEDRLLLGTGNGGVIYAVTTDGDEIVQLADTDAKQITALVAGPDQAIYFGAANKGSVGSLSREFAKEGTFTSQVLDAKQISAWGTMQIDCDTPAGAKLAVSTRSGNVAKPDEKTWSDFSDARAATDEFLKIASPAGRFLQVRFKLTSDGEVSPVVRQVKVVYQMGNLAPVVHAVVVKPADKVPGKPGAPAGGPQLYRMLAIQASDPNADKLTFTVHFRQVGTENWIEIADKLTVPKYVWDTRTVGDGVYELRVTASDSPSNPPAAALSTVRISESLVVDNTPPRIEGLAAEPEANKVMITGSAVDAASRIVSIHYAVDSAKDWTAVLPADGICDAAEETFVFDIEDLEPGSHRIAVRARDVFGNVGYAAMTVTVE
ncbi:MAG: hypothetical protein SVT52_00720 [Planctomycetota bacterium]|nr:hypothetical protein [Planctomycetota bacterium]